MEVFLALKPLSIYCDWLNTMLAAKKVTKVEEHDRISIDIVNDQYLEKSLNCVTCKRVHKLIKSRKKLIF